MNNTYENAMLRGNKCYKGGKRNKICKTQIFKNIHEPRSSNGWNYPEKPKKSSGPYVDP